MSVNKIIKTLGQICVLSVIVLGPWNNGGTEPSFLLFLLYMILASGLLAIVSLWTTPRHERQSNLYSPSLLLSIPLLLGLGISLLQIYPLSEEQLEKFSPTINELKQTQLPSENVNLEIVNDYLSQTFPYVDSSEFNLSNALSIDNKLEKDQVSSDVLSHSRTWGDTISVYPLATRESIPLYWGALILFLSAYILFNTTKSKRFLFKTVAITGLLFALLCIGTRTNPSVIKEGFLKDWWNRYVANGGYGSYVNKNNAGGYLILCLSACIYLMTKEFLHTVRLLNEERQERRDKETHENNVTYKIRNVPVWKSYLGNFFDLFNRRFVCWFFVSSVVLAAIYMSLSRGASVAATIAFSISILYLLCKKETRRYWILLSSVFVFSFVLIGFVGMQESVDTRMGTLLEEDDNGETAIEADSRWLNWQGAMETAKKYYWFGSGLGTYSVANRSTDVALKNDKLFYFAENFFVQTLVEMGIIGTILLILTYVLLFAFLFRRLSGRHSSETSAVAVGLLALLTGQILSGLGDFGVYLPANFLLFTLLCSVGINRQNRRLLDDLRKSAAHRSTSMDSIQKLEKVKKREFLGACVITGLLLFVMLGAPSFLREIRDSATREQLLANSSIESNELAYLSTTSLTGVIKEFEDYISYRDDSFEIRYRLALLKTKEFRLSSLAHLKEKNSENDHVEELWKQTAPEFILDTLFRYQSLGFDVATHQIRNNEQIRNVFPPIIESLLVARNICPLFPIVNERLCVNVPLVADLSWKDEQDLSELYIRRTTVFSPFDSKALFRQGAILERLKKHELQRLMWRKTLEYNVSYMSLVLDSLVLNVPRSKMNQTIEEVVSNDPPIICSALRHIQMKYKNMPISPIMKDKILEIFNNTPEESRDASYYYYASIVDEICEDYQQADKDLQTSLQLDSNNIKTIFRRIRILCKYSNVLDKDAECVQLIKELRPKLSGALLWESNRRLKEAEENLKKSNARKEVQEKIIRERQMDERIRNKVHAPTEETSVPPENESSSEMESDANMVPS